MKPRFRWGPVLFFGVVALAGCHRTADPLVHSGSLKRSSVLAGFGACARELARDFRASAERLEARTAAAGSAVSAENTASARGAWTEAIDLWERNEVLQFGPAAPLDAPGGLDLRAQIYSWPVVGRCEIERALVDQSYARSTFGDGSPATRGLYAAEYVLFYDGVDNACGPTSAINQSGTWAALDPAELAARKAGYAHAVAVDLVRRAKTLEERWSPSGGDFGRELSTAGSSTSLFATQALAFNAVVRALFYLESATKDLKLGRPSGLRDCATDTCPEALESTWARRSKHHVRANLVGGQLLTFGCDAGGQVGFDDLLRATGHADLADRLAAAFVDAIAAVDAVPDIDFDATLRRDPLVLRQLYVTVKRLTDLLRTDFVTALQLDLPSRVEGDND